jgi:hypothetical protein
VRISIKSDEMKSVTDEKYGEGGYCSFEELTNLLVHLRVPEIKTKEQAWIDFEARLVGEDKTAKKRSLSYLVIPVILTVTP